jgi:hypothetical protein
MLTPEEKIISAKKRKEYIKARNATPAHKAFMKIYLKAYFKTYNPKRNVYQKEYRRKYRINHPQYTMERYLKLYYGITLIQYNEIFNSQNGCCKICGTHQSELKKALFVDHDHKTGKIRGLLCHQCNIGIGIFN